MAYLLQFVEVGLVSGCIYALISLGYTMVYGIIELINFAHGDIFMIGTLVAITVFKIFNVTQQNPPTGWALVGILAVTFLITMVFCALLGVFIERIAYRPLRHAPKLAPLISAIGVSLILEDIGKFQAGLNLIAFPTIFPNVSWQIGGVTIRAIDILVVSVAVVLMVSLQYLVQRSKLGRAMRAVAQDSEAAALMGVNVNQIISITFFIGASLAGAAAIVYGLFIGTTVFYVGFKMGLYAFTAAVLGGIGNMAGAMLGGLLIGLIESLVDLIPNSSNGGWGLPHGGTVWPEVAIFGILILILVFRPSGLLGQNTPDKV